MFPRWVFLIAGVGCFIFFFMLQPHRTGDGFEYLYMLQSWHNHGSPDLRPEDIESVKDILGFSRRDPFLGYFLAKTGSYYSYHFWIYSLFSLPTKGLLSLLGHNELAAFQLTNVCFFLISLYLALFIYEAPARKRYILAGLSAIGPVLLYLRWTGPEIYTWSLVLSSIVFINNRNYILAALCSSFAAMHNPPVLFLAASAVLLSIRDRKPRTALFTTGAALLSFLPNVFYLALFGVPSMIVARGGASLDLFSFGRIYEFFFDFNQGMLPYVPGLLCLGVIGFFYAVATKNPMGIGALVLLSLMTAVSVTTRNWNSGSFGLIRYAVWMLPILAWAVAEFLPDKRAFTGAVIGFVGLHACLVFYFWRYDESDFYIRQSPLASFVLREAPSLYNPSHEIFIERQIGEWIGPQFHIENKLPIPFVREDRVVTKILTNAESLDRVKEWFVVGDSYFEKAKKRAKREEGLFYLTPPYGAIQTPVLPSESPVPSVREFRDFVVLNVVDTPSTVKAPNLNVEARVSNMGQNYYWGLGSGIRNRLLLSYRLFENGELLKSNQNRPVFIPYMLAPSQTLPLDITINLPSDPGHYVLEIFTRLHGVGEGKDTARIQIEVEETRKGKYLARLVPEYPEVSQQVEQLEKSIDLWKKLGDWDQASEVLGLAMELDPDNKKLKLNRLELMILKHDERAIEWARVCFDEGIIDTSVVLILLQEIYSRMETLEPVFKKKIVQAIMHPKDVKERELVPGLVYLIGTSPDGWTLDLNPGFIVVRNTRGRPFRLKVQLECYADEKTMPVAAIILGEDYKKEYIFREAGTTVVELPRVVQGDTKIFAVNSDKTFSLPKSSKKLGVRIVSTVQ